MSGAATAIAATAGEFAIEEALAASFAESLAEYGAADMFGAAAADAVGSAALEGGFGAGMEGVGAMDAGSFYGPSADLATNSAADMGMTDLGMAGDAMNGLGATAGNLPSASSSAFDMSGFNVPGPERLPSVLGDAQTGLLEAKTAYADTVPQWMQQGINTANNVNKVKNVATTANSILNPPNPTQFGQRNIQRQMQQPGYDPMYQPNTSSSFGLGGSRNRGAGQMARFKCGGLAALQKVKG